MHQPKDIDYMAGRGNHLHVCTKVYHITLPDSSDCM